MDANIAQILFRQLMTVLEDVWIEKQVCQNLVLDKGLMSEAELQKGLEAAKRNPEYREQARENFANSHKALDEFRADSAFQGLELVPPKTDTQN